MAGNYTLFNRCLTFFPVIHTTDSKHGSSDHLSYKTNRMIGLLFISSGDTDSVVPLTATRYSIDALGLPTVVSWYPWYDKKGVSFIIPPKSQPAFLI